MNRESAIPSASSRERHGGIEMLRLLSMFFVLALHVNFFALGYPSAADFGNGTVRAFLRTFFESATIVGVDCFILISGWFGIRPRTSRVLELLFQCAFFCCLLYAAGRITGVEFNRIDALKNLFFLGKLNWFIRAYLALYLLSPVLEPFAENASETTFRRILVAFFAFQTVYGWAFPVAYFFANGYSAFSFAGLYLLARYVRRFAPRFACRSRGFDFSVYLSLVSVSSVAFFLKTRLGLDWEANLFAYSSPLVVAAALFLFLAFSKLGIRSSFVNGAARSSYAVYLLHAHPCVCATLLVATAKRIAVRPLPEASVRMAALLLSFFAAALLLDQVRILAWRGAVRIFRRRNPLGKSRAL